METAAKQMHVARPTDRLLEALSTLAALLDRTINEVKSLDREFETRLLKTVEEKEASLQNLATENLNRAIRETSEQLRRELTENFTVQIDGVRAEFESEREKLNRELRRVTEAATLMDTERSRLANELDRMHEEAWAQHERSLAALDAVKNEFEIERGGLNRALNRASETSALLETERLRLSNEIERVRQEAQAEREQAQIAAVDAVRAEFEAERARLNHSLNRATETTAVLEAERLRLVSEIERVREQAQVELEKAHAAIIASPSNGSGGNPAALDEEITRTEDRLKVILALIENPATELSAVIRKNVERSELESYLKGIHFALKQGK